MAPVILPGEDARQVGLLLFLGAKADQHRAAHTQAHGCQARRTGQRCLGRPDVSLGQVPTGSTILLRPGRCDPALLEQDFVPADVVLVVEKNTWAEALCRSQLVGKRGVEESLDLFAKDFMRVTKGTVQNQTFPAGAALTAASNSNTWSSSASSKRSAAASSNR